MRTTSQAQFPFDDSLVILKHRQLPLTQTGRGNYEWTWLQAPLVFINEDGDVESSDLVFTADSVAQFVVFGSDVPHTTWLGGADSRIEDALLAIAANTAATATYINTTLNAWFVAAKAAVSALPDPPAAITLDPIVVGIAKLGGVFQLVRPTAFGGTTWDPVVDPGQGAFGVYTVGALSNVEVQGFPIALAAEDVIGAGDTATLERPFLTVGFEGGINHGLGRALETGAGANAQLGYAPIILEQGSYTQAMKDNGNMFEDNGQTFYVVGLWSVFTPTP